MSMRNLLLLTAIASAFVLAGCTTTDNGDGGDGELIRIQSGDADGFNPKNLTISAGTTVTWRNEDNQAHTSTSDDGVWESGNLAPGDTFEFTFDEPGEYPYHCEYHAPQVATIVVE